METTGTDTAAEAMTEDEQAKRMAIVCWSNDLDRVWPTLILATTGAASGLEVDVFFIFWGCGCSSATTSGSRVRTGCRRGSPSPTAAAPTT